MSGTLTQKKIKALKKNEYDEDLGREKGEQMSFNTHKKIRLNLCILDNVSLQDQLMSTLLLLHRMIRNFEMPFSMVQTGRS